MNLNHDQLRRLRAYVSSANTTMGHIPRPVPPAPQLGADGPTFDTRDLYLSYSRLPADLQELAAISHAMCETALECQSNAATHAFVARCLLMAHLVQSTDLAHEQASLYPAQPAHEYLTLVPERSERDERNDSDGGDSGDTDTAEDNGTDTDTDDNADTADNDDRLVAEVERDVEIYMRRRLAQRDAAAAAQAPVPRAPAVATAVELIAELPGELITELPGELITELPGELITEPPVELITELPMELITELITELNTEPPTEPITKPPTEPITGPNMPGATGAPGHPRLVRVWATSATVVAALCVILLAWQHLAPPAAVPTTNTTRPADQSVSRSMRRPVSQSINQSIQAGDMTAIISHAERIDDATEIHVQMVNFGAEPAPATVSLGQDERDPPAGPAMVPARSTQHRVLHVRDDRDWTKPVELLFQNTQSMITIE